MNKQKNFKVMIVKKDGKPVGVRAAQVNGEDVIIALHDDDSKLNWFQANDKYKLPTIAQWAAIGENLKDVNKALENSGGSPLDGWFWSSSEYNNYFAWIFCTGTGAVSGGLYGYGKDYYDSDYVVRPVLAF